MQPEPTEPNPPLDPSPLAAETPQPTPHPAAEPQPAAVPHPGVAPHSSSAPQPPQAKPLPVPLPESFTVYLARHATPDRSRADIPYHSLPGPDLNERGLQEAAELAAYLREMGVVAILSSPFERTRRTALIASEQFSITVDLDPDLGERQPVEPEAVVSERMLRAFAIGAQRSAQLGPVAIVTHGAPVLVLLKALGLPPATLERCRIYDNRNPIPMAGAWRIERLDSSLTMRPVFAPLGMVLPNYPYVTEKAPLPKENP